MKRKTAHLNEYEIERVYEWKLALNQGLGKSCCEECAQIEAKLKKILGRSALELAKLVIKHPYFKKPRK